MATPVTTPVPSSTPSTPAPRAERSSHGGVMYVGPSLTRSLLGVALALTRATA